MADVAKGELQINDADIKKHAPDLINEHTRQGLATSLQTVYQIKPKIDTVMQHIGEVTNTKMSSRVKNPKQIVRKVVQKRMEDRTYQLSNINDLLGYRFTTNHKNEMAQVIKEVEKAGKMGAFVIIDQQERDKADYHAYHFDVGFPIPNGKTIRGEIQIMDARSEAQAAVSHDAHFIYGEKPPKQVQKTLTKQNNTIQTLPPIKAKQVAKTLINAHKQVHDNPLPKGFATQVLANATK
jgi:ppGpp synthetase/RelA/SpoT-type nucleotidyltranferase